MEITAQLLQRAPLQGGKVECNQRNRGDRYVKVVEGHFGPQPLLLATTRFLAEHYGVSKKK